MSSMVSELQEEDLLDSTLIIITAKHGHSPIDPKRFTSPVETTQVAPTILTALGLNPGDLQAVQKEHTQVLPGVSF